MYILHVCVEARGRLLKLQAVFLARQAGHLRSPSLSHRVGDIDMCTMPSLCVGAVDPVSPHNCSAAGILHSKPSPHPYPRFLCEPCRLESSFTLAQQALS